MVTKLNKRHSGPESSFCITGAT